MSELFDFLGSLFLATIGPGASAFLGFVLQYLPDPDAELMGFIDSMARAFAGDGLTFNVLYFVDVGMVAGFLGMFTLVYVASLILIAIHYVMRFIEWALGLVHKVLDSIPVIG